MPITAKSYFSGAGGLDLGLQQAGVKILESFEIDKKCCNTLEKNFKHKVNRCDITQVTVLDQQDADVYVGTFPCQKYSRIADIHGTRTGDDLFLHFFRHVALARPEAFVVENVPGMMKFPVVMEALTKIPDYKIQVVCPVNARLWLPQDRPRLILFGTRHSGFYTQMPLPVPHRLSEVLEDDPVVNVPDYVKRRLEGNYRDRPIITTADGVAPTCVAHYSKDVSTRLVNDGKRIRPYSLLEYQRLQGFPDWFTFDGTVNDGYRMVGNAVAVPVGKWIGEQLIRYFKEVLRW